MRYIVRFTKLTAGLFLFALGYYLGIQANIGLAPWNAFNVGIAARLGTTYGVISVATAVVIMGIDLLLHESIGWGTIFDAVLVGVFVDLLTRWEIVPLLHNFWWGLLVLIIGTELCAVGSWLYISAALGEGPRDTLMVALCKRFSVVPIGVVRSCIEGLALLIGWLAGAKVGIGTVVSVFGMGLFIQVTFRVLRFDVRTVQNESLSETVRHILKRE